MKNRREFLKTAMVASAGLGAAASQAGAAPAGPKPTGTNTPARGDQTKRVDRRVLGRTGVEVSILGLGLGSAFTRPLGRQPDQAHELLRQALDHGVNYWDTCRGYGNSEDLIGPVVEKHRDEIFLVTKSDARDYDGFMRDFETSLKKLRTDRVDLLHFWKLSSTRDTDRIAKADGALKAVRELKDQKVIAHHGITGHDGARVLMDAMKRLDPDAVLTVFPCTRDDQGRYEDELLPLAREKNMGVIGMKTVRKARNADLVGTDLIRYALSLDGVHSTIVGLDTIEHLTANAKMATRFEPLTVAQRDAMHREVSLAVADIPTPWEQPGYQDGQTFA